MSQFEPSPWGGSADPALLRWGHAGAIALHLLVLGDLWGRWPAFWFAAAGALLMGIFNGPLVFVLDKRWGRSRAEDVRTVGDLCYLLLLGHVSGWVAPVWGFLVFMALPFDGTADRHGRWRLPAAIVALDVASALDGGFAVAALSASLLAILVREVSEAGIDLIRRLYDGLREEHGRLEQAHADLVRTQERAVGQEKLAALGLLSAGIAHEINNPLAYVKANVAALSRDLAQLPGKPDLLAEYAAEVLPATLEGVNRIARIVADLRHFARGSSEELLVFDLNAEVETVLRLARGQLERHGERGCKVELDLSASLPSLLGSPQRIDQVVLNLLVNACQSLSGEREGRVQLSTRARGGEIRLAVRDNGCGMSPEIQKRLFQPFFTTKPVGQGTGLGLSVVHGIVQAHGGRIEVESTPGEGSCFTVVLPAAPPVTRRAA